MRKQLKVILAIATILVLAFPLAGCFGDDNGKKDPTVMTIRITSTTHQQVYRKGDALNLNGLAIEAKYTDNTTENPTVTPDMVSGFVTETTDELQTITVAYEGKTATYNVIVVSDEAYLKQVIKGHNELFFQGFNASVAEARGINNKQAFVGFNSLFDTVWNDIFAAAFDEIWNPIFNAKFDEEFEKVVDAAFYQNWTRTVNEALDALYAIIYTDEFYAEKYLEIMKEWVNTQGEQIWADFDNGLINETERETRLFAVNNPESPERMTKDSEARDEARVFLTALQNSINNDPEYPSWWRRAYLAYKYEKLLAANNGDAGAAEAALASYCASTEKPLRDLYKEGESGWTSIYNQTITQLKVGNMTSGGWYDTYQAVTGMLATQRIQTYAAVTGNLATRRAEVYETEIEKYEELRIEIVACVKVELAAYFMTKTAAQMFAIIKA